MATQFSEHNNGAVHAATDITGFGLLGHAREMALASKVSIEIDHRNIEPLPGALEAIRQGCLPGGLKNNREFASCAVSVGAAVPADIETLLYDPQTSGGLLISVSAAAAPALEAALRRADIQAAIIGRVAVAREKSIIVL
ncbi:MAG: hypothetical protein HY648_00165 [Acidobacteria bacterium]|nr:hypothetical protein [Acidobacteriota bacterium]